MDLPPPIFYGFLVFKEALSSVSLVVDVGVTWKDPK